MLRTILAPRSELWEDGQAKNWYDGVTILLNGQTSYRKGSRLSVLCRMRQFSDRGHIASLCFTAQGREPGQS